MSTDQKIDLRLHLPQDEFDYNMLAEAARASDMTVEEFGVAAVQMAVAAALMPDRETDNEEIHDVTRLRARTPPAAMTRQQIKQAATLRGKGFPLVDISRLLGLPLASVRRALNTNQEQEVPA